MTPEKRKAADSEQDTPRKQTIFSTHCQSRNCSSSDSNGTLIIPASLHNANEHQSLIISREKKKIIYVDFIERLPFEIFCHILSYLDTQLLLQCTQVSHIWRSKLLDHRDLWRKIEVRYMSNILQIAAIRGGGGGGVTKCQQQYRVPSILQQHIEKLTFYDQISTFLNCTEFLRMHDFSNLVSLDLNISVGYGANIRSPELLYNTLACVKHTLTDLRIVWPRIQNTRISLLRILSLCQNLTAIKLTAWCIGDCVISHKTLLSRMELHSTISIQPLFQLSSLLWHCPHLRYLEVNGCEHDEDIVPILTKCCPELIIIITRKMTQQQHIYSDEIDAIVRQYKKRLSSSFSAPVENATFVSTTPQEKKKLFYRPGELQCLVLHNIYSVLPLQTRLEKSQNSLHTLSFAPMGGTERDWTRLSTLSLPRLTFFYTKISNASTEFLRDHLPSMLRNYQALETLVLEGSCHYSTSITSLSTTTVTAALERDHIIADGIFRAIGELPSLSSLRLSHLDIRGRTFGELLDSHHNISMKYSHHSHHRSSSAHLLRELTFHHCVGVTSSILQSVSGIVTLKKLSIYRPEQQVTVLEIARLIRLRLHQLTCLELGLMLLTNENATALASCQNLSTLLLYKMKGAGRKRVDQLLRPYIKHVKVQWR